MYNLYPFFNQLVEKYSHATWLLSDFLLTIMLDEKELWQAGNRVPLSH